MIIHARAEKNCARKYLRMNTLNAFNASNAFEFSRKFTVFESLECQGIHGNGACGFGDTTLKQIKCKDNLF